MKKIICTMRLSSERTSQQKLLCNEKDAVIKVTVTTNKREVVHPVLTYTCKTWASTMDDEGKTCQF